MKAQPMISCQLPWTPAGRPKPSRRPTEILLGCTNGSSTSRTSGIIEATPSTVAKVAPSRMPSRHGTNMTSRIAAPTINWVRETVAPKPLEMGPKVWLEPALMLKRAMM